MSRKHIGVISALAAAGLLVASNLLSTAAKKNQASTETSPDPSNVYRVTEASGSGKGKGGSAGRNSSGNDQQVSGPRVTPSPPEIPDFVKAEIPEHESWMGETCTPPRRGSICVVPFEGGAHSSGEPNTLHFLAFENGRGEPAMHHQFPVKKGLTTIDTWLEYRVGLDTDWVEFRVELRNAKGEVLAASFPQKIPIYTPSG